MENNIPCKECITLPCCLQKYKSLRESYLIDDDGLIYNELSIICSLLQDFIFSEPEDFQGNEEYNTYEEYIVNWWIDNYGLTDYEEYLNSNKKYSHPYNKEIKDIEDYL